MPNAPQTIEHRAFLGLNTSIGDPPSNSAKNISNLVLHRRRGILEQADGYGLKFPDGETDLPQVTDPAKPNYIDPAIHKISSLTWENIHNFFVPDHGGRNITVAVGKYTKASFFPTSPSTDQFGVWVRPWYDPVQQLWSDDNGWDTKFPQWQELTEFQVFELLGPGNGGVFPQISNGVSFANDNSIGTVSWVSPNNAQTRDDLSAYVDLSAVNHTSHYLKIGGVDLATLVPSATAIVGIEVYIRVKSGNGTTHSINVSSIQLTKNGAPIGDDKGFAVPLPPTDTYVPIRRGGSTDTWGAGIGVTDVLGVTISVHNYYETSSARADIDHVYFKVYTNQPGDYRLKVSTGIVKYGFHTIDGVNRVFSDDYFKGWVLVYNQLEDAENYDLIRNCGYNGTDYFLELYHPNTDFTSRVTGTKLIAYRNFIHRGFPSSVSTFIYNLLSEIRLTTGNGANDVSLMAGFRTNTMTITAGGLQYTVGSDNLICDTQTMDFWQYAAIAGINPYMGGVDLDPLDPGSYYVKYALRLDDGCVSKMYDAGVKILNGTKELQLDIYRSFGAFPRRGKSVVIFVSTDNLQYVQVVEIDLTIGSFFTQVGVVTLPVGKHFYMYGTTQITKTILKANDGDSTVWTDKANEDDGIIRYKQALVVTPNTYAIGVRDASLDKVLPNQIFVSAIAGTIPATRQYDVFPNDPTHVIDLEFSDGDEIIALGALDQTIVALKRRSIVLVAKDRTFGFVRQFVTRGYGISSFRTLIAWDDFLYWLDYNGVIEFSTRGINVVNYSWLQDLRDMSDGVKEAAIAIVDRVNRQYRLSLNGKMYVMDLDTRVWTIEDYLLPPARFAVDIPGTIDFLVGNSVETIAKGDGLQDTQNYSILFETNEVQHGASDEDVDLNVVAVFLRYKSDIELTLRLFKNDTTEEIGGSPWTLPKDKVRIRVNPIEARCSSFRLQLSGTTTDVNQTVSVLRLGAKYEIIPAGGTELSE